MDAPKLRTKDNPEARIQKELRDFLAIRNWFVKVTHGNMFSEGLPDLIACHYSYGIRFIEVKLPDMKGSKFTPAQMRDFPMFSANGCGIWVLTGATELEYGKLFKPANFWQYLDTWKK